MRFPPENLEDRNAYLIQEPNGEIPFFYVAQIGRLFCAISLLEQSTYGLLLTRATSDTFEGLHQQLRKSTFGQLVGKLESEGVLGRDMSYLRSVNKLRK